MNTFIDDLREEVIQAALVEGVHPGTAANIADRVEDVMRRTKGGIEHYVHGIDIDKRNEQLMSEFTGKNHDELCRRYGIGRRQIQKIIKRYYESRSVD